MQASARQLKFVRGLLRGGAARRGADGLFRLAGNPAITLAATDVAAFASAGILVLDKESCRATAEAGSWLRRQLLGADSLASQHRQEVRLADGTLVNLAESPLARLAVAAAGEAAPFLAPHQVEAGERVRKLVERAQLRQRVIMAYDAAHTAGGRGGNRAQEIGDLAVDARRHLADIAGVLPHDCADVVFDVCGLLKGLQQVETERGWPRRSAKLVLRIGLDQLARHFGLGSTAVGRPRVPSRGWMEGARPELFGDA
jgi:hypothetical protein